MSAAKIARLADRGVVSVTGQDSEKLLQGLVTNDVEGLRDGEARHAALLSPQGKILFDFFILRRGDGYLLDVLRASAGDLAKRLSMYKLRADVIISDVSDSFKIYAAWGGETAGFPVDRAMHFPDPRHSSLGVRLIVEGAPSRDSFADADSEIALRQYDALRVLLGVPEGGRDYKFGDAYPHEADFDLFNGVSFSKGCYVGQEIVARMQNKTVVRKRAVKISGSAPLSSNDDVLVGDVSIGRIGTVDGTAAIAMLRLDRALEAKQKSQPLAAGDAAVSVDDIVLESYAASAAARSSTSLPSP
ncbi:folate-binding protein [Hyphomicrobium sp.]|uniref:CAF17-like 4Fe-4S cluster assembly/insertion protein YgfZ n=1 Tax=Hyphomicrobium sp. TaxID=82 RepID=UPI000FA138D6|nr:folate-binding protein [Hyphomicrobium sp.]RUP10024.1 MAG: folate-binding protein [Hyphomicrobium sp.]